MPCIQYAAGYKYQLRHTYSLSTGIACDAPIRTDWLEMTAQGQLTIHAGYAWDGASGPTFDSKSSMRASLVHDAGYQMIRLGLLPPSTRAAWDDLFHRLCREDGMWKPRAWLWFHAVRGFASPATDPASEAPDECAPGGCEGCTN